MFAAVKKTTFGSLMPSSDPITVLGEIYAVLVNMHISGGTHWTHQQNENFNDPNEI